MQPVPSSVEDSGSSDSAQTSLLQLSRIWNNNKHLQNLYCAMMRSHFLEWLASLFSDNICMQTWWISVRPRWMTMTSSVGGSRATHVISATTLLVIATTSRSIWRANMILAVTIVPTVTSTSRLDRTCQDTCSLHVLWRVVSRAMLYANLARINSNGKFQMLWTSLLPRLAWAMIGPTPASCAPTLQGTSTIWDCTSKESTIWAAITTRVKNALSNTKPGRICLNTGSCAFLNSANKFSDLTKSDFRSGGGQLNTWCGPQSQVPVLSLWLCSKGQVQHAAAPGEEAPAWPGLLVFPVWWTLQNQSWSLNT